MEFEAQGRLYQVVLHEDELGTDVEIVCDGKSIATILLGAGSVTSVILPEAILLPRAREMVH